MESRAKFLGHSIHQMLIVFPLGMLGGSVIFDLLSYFNRNSNWNEVAYALIAAGVVSGLIAAVFGLIDWLAIPAGTRAKRVGIAHAAANVIAIALFAVSWFVRTASEAGPVNPPSSAYWISASALVMAAVGGWLGGELVGRLGVGVDDGANLNAPNSLSTPSPATGQRAFSS